MLFGVPSNLRYKKMHRLKAVYLVKKRRNSNVVLTQQLFEQKFFCPKFCEFYLKSLSAGNITSNQIEAIRRAVKRTFKKDVFLKINLSLFDHLTKKPISSRMGKGKGKPYK
jgi:ribosomal protein L16/L10AE